METDEEIAKRWRHRAEELRVLAATFGDFDAAKDLLELASKWDVMAKRAADRAAAKKASAD